MTEDEGGPPAGAEPALAAVVDRRRSEATIRSLRAEGVYDDSRRIVEYGKDAVALPVTKTPTDTDVREMIEQLDPEPRAPGLADLLRERGWTDHEIEQAPASWAVVGSVVLAKFDDCPRLKEVGEALLELHGEADTVLDRRGVAGAHREPDVAVVAGEGDTETVHQEHGTKYAMDLAEVMFSPGNKAERARMGELAAAGESVLDMFAGIGYFALPMARAGTQVTAVERNPVSFRYLLENASLNGVTDRIEPYRGDCREVVPTLPAGSADRVVLGYYDATAPAEEVPDPAAVAAGEAAADGDTDADGGHPYLDAAFQVVAPGGTLHVHAAVPQAELWDRPEGRIAAAAADADRDFDVVDRRTVKTYSEGVDHVVLDVRVD